MKPFLILQLRPIDLAADNEYFAFLKYGGLKPNEVHRIRMEKEPIPEVDLNDYSGIIIGGGPSNVSDDENLKENYQKRFETELKKLLSKAFNLDYPVFGNCYGLGSIVNNFGGKVSKEKYGEDVGALQVELTNAGKEDDLLVGIPSKFLAYGGHKEACQQLPEGAVLLGSSENCPVQMIRVGKNIYGTQFHTELDVEGIVLRINIYKNHGYFSANEADQLIQKVKKDSITEPFQILQQFVKKHRKN